MLKTWAAAIWLVQIILQQNAVALIRIYNENFVWQLILSWYLSIWSYRSNHCSKEMYSGRAGLAALPLGMGQTVKNFRRKLLMKCVKAVLVLWWRGWDRGTIIFVVCLLSPCCNSLFSTSPQLRVTSLSPTLCTAQLSATRPTWPSKHKIPNH